MSLQCSYLQNSLPLPGVMLAVAVLIWTAAFAYGRASNQQSPADLDLWLQQQRYVELEHILATSSSGLPPLSRAFFVGVMANRTNQVARSIQLRGIAIRSGRSRIPLFCRLP